MHTKKSYSSSFKLLLFKKKLHLLSSQTISMSEETVNEVEQSWNFLQDQLKQFVPSSKDLEISIKIVNNAILSVLSSKNENSNDNNDIVITTKDLSNDDFDKILNDIDKDTNHIDDIKVNNDNDHFDL